MVLSIFRKILVFVKRDFFEAISSRLGLFMLFLGIFAELIVWYSMSKLFGTVMVPHLKDYRGDYFSFALIGIAFTRFFLIWLKIFPAKVNEAQVTGSLEAMFTTPTSTSLILILSSLWSFIFAFIQVLIYLLCGIFFFNAKIVIGNLFIAVIVLLLTALSISGIGIIAASLMLIFKGTGYITGIVSYLFMLFSGVYYPITVLPSWLQHLSKLLPITHSLEITRRALIRGVSLRELAPGLCVLILFTITLLPLSLIIFNLSVKKAKSDGSLTYF